MGGSLIASLPTLYLIQTGLTKLTSVHYLATELSHHSFRPCSDDWIHLELVFKR
jgi:hypothetical protein